MGGEDLYGKSNPLFYVKLIGTVAEKCLKQKKPITFVRAAA